MACRDNITQNIFKNLAIIILKLKKTGVVKVQKVSKLNNILILQKIKIKDLEQSANVVKVVPVMKMKKVVIAKILMIPFKITFLLQYKEWLLYQLVSFEHKPYKLSQHLKNKWCHQLKPQKLSQNLKKKQCYELKPPLSNKHLQKWLYNNTKFCNPTKITKQKIT